MAFRTENIPRRNPPQGISPNGTLSYVDKDGNGVLSQEEFLTVFNQRLLPFFKICTLTPFPNMQKDAMLVSRA